MQNQERVNNSRAAFKFSRRAAAIWMVGAVGLIAAGCGGSSSSPANSSALKPIDRAALQTLVDTTARELLIPGAVVLLRTPQGTFTATYGTIQIGTTSPPSVDTYFRIASNTKTMTAAVIMQLSQEGKLNLSDAVSKYVPGVPNGNNITIAQLLEMRSGLYNYTNDPEIAANMDRNQTRTWSPNELLSIAFAHPAEAAPDTEYEYNNTNYVLLGLIAEKVDGKTLKQLMQDRLFGPLGMRHTAISAPADYTLPIPYSHGYLYGSASVAMVGEPPYSDEVKAAAQAGTLLPNDFTNLNHSFAMGTGNVYSNANDVATWIRALVSGHAFNAASYRRWIDSVKLEDPSKPDGQEYGYGIARLRWAQNTIYFHGGETPGFNSFMGHDPNSQVTLVVWTNLTNALDEKPTANTLMLKVLDLIYKVSPLPSSQSAIP